MEIVYVSLFGGGVFDNGCCDWIQSVVAFGQEDAGEDEIRVDSRRLGADGCDVFCDSRDVVPESYAVAGLFVDAGDGDGRHRVVRVKAGEGAGSCGDRVDSSVGGRGGIGIIVSGIV